MVAANLASSGSATIRPRSRALERAAAAAGLLLLRERRDLNPSQSPENLSETEPFRPARNATNPTDTWGTISKALIAGAAPIRWHQGVPR